MKKHLKIEERKTLRKSERDQRRSKVIKITILNCSLFSVPEKESKEIKKILKRILKNK